MAAPDDELDNFEDDFLDAEELGEELDDAFDEPEEYDDEARELIVRRARPWFEEW